MARMRAPKRNGEGKLSCWCFKFQVAQLYSVELSSLMLILHLKSAVAWRCWWVRFAPRVFEELMCSLLVLLPTLPALCHHTAAAQ